VKYDFLQLTTMQYFCEIFLPRGTADVVPPSIDKQFGKNHE